MHGYFSILGNHPKPLIIYRLRRIDVNSVARSQEFLTIHEATATDYTHRANFRSVRVLFERR